MSSPAGSSAAAARRYAKALLDLAQQAGQTDSVERDLQDLEKMLESAPELRAAIQNPLYNREQQQRTIMALAEKAKFQQLTANFLGVLGMNRRLPDLVAILGAVKDELAARRGEVKASVETAFALTEAQTRALREQLRKTIGADVALNVSVNRDLLGGMVVTVGSRMIDDSVARKLERLRRVMKARQGEVA